MRFKMKQKILAWGDDFTIYDANGNKAYHVDGKVFSFGDKLDLNDAEGNTVAKIDQKLLSLGQTYDVYRIHNGEETHAARVKKRLFSFMRSKFIVDVPGPDDLEVTGSILDHEYTFERHNKTVATVSKTYFSLRDAYGIDIAPSEDPVLILAYAVVVDMIMHNDKD